MIRFLAILALVACPLAAGENVRPNVILIISDDQGFTDFGFMGSEVAKTPNLDRMAAASLLYTRGYAMPVCSPSLGCLLTGRMPHAHGITGNDLSDADIAALQAKGKLDRAPLTGRLLRNSIHIPKALTDAGYRTFQTGKLWNVTAQEVGFTAGMTDKKGRHGGDGLTIGRQSMQPIFDFIDSATQARQPFFVWYAPLLPHQPHNPPEELLENYRDKGLSAKAAKYYAMVEWFDRTCGELDSFLEQRGLSENTAVVFLTDNGWDAEEGNRAKLSPYELGIRTPIFVRWPAKVKPLRDEETLASIIDIVPTVLAACGVDVPKELPGIDLLDRESATARKTVFVEGYTHDIANLENPVESLVTQVAISGWEKLLLPGPRRPDKAYTSAPEAIELYDLKNDPLEKRNLADERPESVRRLTETLARQWDWRATVSSIDGRQ